MLYLNSNSTNPYYNLALEEYIFHNAKPGERVFLLWQNDNAIVVGRYQNTIEEINQEFVRDNGIRVVRRITGGGAVYHDMGNVNFSFIQDVENIGAFDFSFFTRPVVDALAKLDVNAEFNSRNDLSINGRKFSGNAQTVRNNRILHHGTLLFNSNLECLKNALVVKQDKIESKGIKSVQSRVTNISEHLKRDIGVDEFKSLLVKNMFSYSDLQEYALTAEDREAIQKLHDGVYRTWDWNYGSSPEFTMQKQRRFDFGSISVLLKVDKGGKIGELKIYGDFFGNGDINELESLFTGLPLREDAIMAALQHTKVGYYINGTDPEKLTRLIVY